MGHGLPARGGNKHWQMCPSLLQLCPPTPPPPQWDLGRALSLAFPISTRMDWISALPSSATTPLLGRNIFGEASESSHSDLTQTSPNAWALFSLHFKKSWLREGKRLAQSHTARQQQSQELKFVWIYS